MKLTVTIIVIILFFLPATGFAKPADLPADLYWQLEHLERYIYPSDMSHLGWQEIRNQREARRNAHKEPKTVTLTGGDGKKVTLNDPITVSVMDPDGRVNDYQGTSVKLPEDLDLIGRYLIGSSFPLGSIINENTGREEPLIYCSKGIFTHYKNGGRVGDTSVVFWNDPERLPLEIGPVLDTAKSRYGGGMQATHREYEMVVRYQAKPLAGAEVTVTPLGSGWSQTLTTDSRGVFKVMPTDDRLNQLDYQIYLYSTSHHDPEKNVTYVSTFPVTIYKSRLEYRSKTMGFTFWAIIGTGLTLLIIAGYRGRKAWEERRGLIVFENQTIKES